MPVPDIRLFMSLLARDRSATLVCSSPLTVANSSLSDCNSSLEVSSSSLVDCNSSFTDCISSLEEVSSSLAVASSSLEVWRYSTLARSSCCRTAMGGSGAGIRRRPLGPFRIRLRCFLQNDQEQVARNRGTRARGHPLDRQIDGGEIDRKSKRLNSSHPVISYAVFCLK